MRLSGERLGGKHPERCEHTRGIRVASLLNRHKDHGRDLRWHLGLLQRYEQCHGELLQLGRILERGHFVEDRHQLRGDLLVRDV